jgi:1-deoxy-D-xylulose-5-phosphate reductoisomerase
MTAMNLTILGATGSVGASTLDVLGRHPERYRTHALTAHSGAAKLLELCRQHRPRHAVLSGMAEDGALRRQSAEAGTDLRFGAPALIDVAAHTDCHAVMAAIVGAAGLPATLAAARAGKRVLLANKEALVMAGPLFMETVRAASALLLPIDSEHNAVFQCLAGNPRHAVRRVVLTASGGPFRAWPVERLRGVTPEEACAHPNWTMGRKISVDSATMMNKGLEIIEAHWLFGLEPAALDVLIHPQSIVHSMVEYVDGSVIAQLSNPDMRVPIAHALAFPERVTSGVRPLDLAALQSLSFERLDEQRFPCMRFAYQALRQGGSAPAVLNAANEVAVEAFLGRRLPFTGIASLIEDTLDAVATTGAADLEAILGADAQARRAALARVQAVAEAA